MSGALQSQLALVEEKFLSSIIQGPSAMDSFTQRWSSLQSTIAEGVKQQSLDEETLTLAHMVFSRIEIMSEQLLGLCEESDAITTAFQQDLAVLFDDLNIDASTSPSSKSAAYLAVRPSDTTVPLPPYTQPAHAWLLDNLHNPYPSKDTRIAIANKTGSSLKDIDNWFINARKRIGWNKLRLKHFQNKRSKIVDAATRFFKWVPQSLRRGPQITNTSDIGPTANHNSEFRAIENRAKELYPDKSFEVPLAAQSGSIVRDLMPEMKGEEGHRRQVVKSWRGQDLQRLSAYPSPEPSPERSPEPSATVPLPNNVTIATSRKRRNLDRNSPEIEDRRDELQKRSRLDSYQSFLDLGAASLPSPAASTSDIPQESPDTSGHETPSKADCIILPPISTMSSGKRKRRLSDAASDGPSKRPHNALAVPRLQTVSDPLPLASPITNEWHKMMFGKAISNGIPDSVSVESLDDTQVEVDLYDYNTPPDTIEPFLLANSFSCPRPAAPSAPPIAISELPSLDISQAIDPNFDFLFENYLKDFNTPQDISFLHGIPSHDPTALFPFGNMLPTQPPQEAVLPDALSYFQIPSLSWDFQGNDDSFSTVTTSAGTLFSSNHVPPQIDPIQNEKEAKLKQIEALRAQLQNLEAEL